MQAPKKPSAVKHTRQELEKSCQSLPYMLKLSPAYKAVKTVLQVLPHLFDWSFGVLPHSNRTRFFVLSVNSITLVGNLLQPLAMFEPIKRGLVLPAQVPQV